MKNIIPLIVAVILGLAAVYIVSRTLITQENSEQEPQVSVVIAARDLVAGEELQPGSCSFKNLPKSAVPETSLLWDNVNLAYGQKLPHDIKQGSYILFEDIQLNVALADCVSGGRWLIPVTFSDPTLVKMLRPQDEIAIAASYADKEKAPVKQQDSEIVDQEQPAAVETETEESRETVVLFPCVEVIGLDNEKGLFREAGSSTATIFVCLPPRQAMILLAAQREAELYPILRRRNDSAAMNRRDIGSVNSKTFQKIRSGLETAELPDSTINKNK